MPKYSVNEILDIIRSLSNEEKQELCNQIPEVLGSSLNKSQIQSQTFGNVSISGSGIVADLGQQQVARGNISSHQVVEQGRNMFLQEALEELEKLKQLASSSGVLDPLQEATTQAQIKVATDELKKPEPDKGLVSKTIAVLKQGLEGVITLAEPVMKAANLVAKAWGIPIP